MAHSPSVNAAQRLVIKVGSALVVESQLGSPLRKEWIRSLCQDIAELRHETGAEIIIVTSGAIALARQTLNLSGKKLRLDEKQAAASVGQIQLAQIWSAYLQEQGLQAAQLLLAPDETENRRRYLNARATLNTLLSMGCVPVINENDAIATAEIRAGDNDRLAACVAEMVSADQLILFSNIDGLYTADPRKDVTAQHIPIIENISPEIERMGGAPLPGYPSGGMRTKLAAARIAMQSGCAMAIAPGQVLHPLRVLRQGGRCSWFLAAREALCARKNWISGGISPAGRVHIDHESVNAIREGCSLLPLGLKKVEGEFGRADLVDVIAPSGECVARGLVYYTAGEMRLIAGRQSEEIERILGWYAADEIIHHDNMMLIPRSPAS